MNDNYYKKYEPVFGAWEIKDKIGEGQFGKVYVIERNELGTTYKAALKAITVPQNESEIKSVMAEGMSEDNVIDYYKSIVYDIVNEFKIMAQLKGNSNIVSYEDHMIIKHEDKIGWDILIRMELLMPLNDYIADNPMTSEDVEKLGKDLCKALVVCEKKGIVHRDIKPENIFISDTGDYKLGDFGVARTVEKATSTMSKKGTYTYMAPEVFRGEAYNHTVDLYSLGIVMYKMLNNNRTPFLPEAPNPITFQDKEKAIFSRMRGDLIPKPANGSEELKDIIIKACEYNEEDRYSSPSEMLNDLENKKLLKNKDKKRKTKKNTDNKNEYNLKEENKPNECNDNEESISKHKTKKKKKIMLIVCAGILIVISALLTILIPGKVEDIQVSGMSQEKPTVMYLTHKSEPEYKILPVSMSDETIERIVTNPKVISVDNSGSLKAVGVGKTELILKARRKEVRYPIIVKPQVLAINGVKSKIELTEGQKKIIKVKLKKEKACNNDNIAVSYKIKNKGIATTDKKGIITAKKKGKTTLVITAGGKKIKVNIFVKKPVVKPVPAPVTNSNNYNSGGSSDSVNSGSGGGSAGGGSKAPANPYDNSSGDGYNFTI